LHRYNNSDISNELNLAKITNVHSYCGAVTTVTASQKYPNDADNDTC